jgi:hypothetical protein
VFLTYAQARLSPSDYEALATRIVRFMESTRGFLRFGGFVAIVRDIRRERPEKLHQAFPEIIARARLLSA